MELKPFPGVLPLTSLGCVTLRLNSAPSFSIQHGDIQLEEAGLRGNHEEKRSDGEAVAMAEGRANFLQAGATMITVCIIQSYLQKS